MPKTIQKPDVKKRNKRLKYFFLEKNNKTMQSLIKNNSNTKRMDVMLKSSIQNLSMAMPMIKKNNGNNNGTLYQGKEKRLPIDYTFRKYLMMHSTVCF